MDLRLRPDVWLQKASSVVPSGSVLLAGSAVVVGLGSAAGVWAFKLLIEFFHRLAFDQIGATISALGPWTVALIPALGGLLVGLLWRRFVGDDRYHGVAGIMEAVALVGGRLQYWLMPVKTVAAALSIGFGASVGPEDPSVQIGANLGSMAGQKLRLSDSWVRTLVGAGSAAGISAAFNAPIAGVFFALEIVLGEIAGTNLGVIVLASVISAVFTQSVSGAQPAFRVPEYAFHSPRELPLYLGLGMLAGLVAAAYVYALYRCKDLFAAWRRPGWVKTATAGLLVGVVGIFLPAVFGVGYDTIEKILASASFSVALLVALLLAKLLMTAVSISGGFPGGVFAPSMFLGATLGAAYGSVLQGYFPLLLIAPPAYAMVGMAAVLAASVHAPLTAVLLLFEMTRDYHIILPLMFAVIVGMVVSQFLQRDSVYTLGLARKGLRLQRGRDIEVLEGISVGEVMETGMVSLYESDSLAEASAMFMDTRHHGLMVVDAQGGLVGVLTVQDLEGVQAQENWESLTVGDICTRDLLVAHPQESIGAALQRMSIRDIGRLPVVMEDDPRRLLGVLRRSDLVRAYDVALTRRAALRHRAHQATLGVTTGTGVQVRELLIQAGAVCDGRRIQEISWPRESVIASLRRGRRVLIPHGDTTLRSGDVLAIVADEDAVQLLERLCGPQDLNRSDT